MHRKKRSWLWILIPIVVAGILCLLFIHAFLDPELHRKVLQDSLRSALGREVSIGKTKITLWGGIGVSFDDFCIKDSTLASDLLRSKRLILRMSLIPLLRREVRWKRVILERPALHLYKDEHGNVNLFDRSSADKGGETPRDKTGFDLSAFWGSSLAIRDGAISLTDAGLGDGPVVTEMKSLNFRISRLSPFQACPFRFDAMVLHSMREGLVSISGTLQNLSREMSLSTVRMDAGVWLKGIEISHFWPYLKGRLPMERISGVLDLEGHFDGSLSEAFKTSAKIKLRDLVYDHPQVFTGALASKWVSLDLDLNYDSHELRISRIALGLPEIKVYGKGKIYGIGTTEMGMEAEARSNPFDLLEARKFIPYRIIVPAVSEPLFRAEGQGPVQIHSVKLSGKMAEIEHCDLAPHAHTLSVEMTVNGIRLKLPWDLPALENLKGHLSFKNGNLTMRGVEGKVSRSRIEKADGEISRLLLMPTLQIRTKGRLHLTDLPMLTKIGEMSKDFTGTFAAVRPVSGEMGYELSAKGELRSPVRFQHEGVYHFSKVRLTHPQIPFPILLEGGRLDLSNEGGRWSGVKAAFGDSSFLMNGLFKPGANEGLFEMAAKGRFDLRNLFTLAQSNLFPEEIRRKSDAIQRVSGTGQLSLGVRRSGHGPFSFEGEVAVKEAFLLLKEHSTPFTFIDGGFSFSNLGVGFSKLKILSRASSLTLDGSIKEGNFNLNTSGAVDLGSLHSFFRTPFFPDPIRLQAEQFQNLSGKAQLRLRWIGRMGREIEALRDGEIQLRGISFLHPKISLPFSQVEGALFFSPKEIRFEGLHGKVGDSLLSLSGSVSRMKPPRAFVFRISSPQLDLNLLFPRGAKAATVSFEGLREWLSSYSVQGKIDLDQGKYDSLHFQEVGAEVKTINGRLFIRPFRGKANGGNLWGEGWVEPREKGIGFEIMPRISAIEAKAFLRTLLQKKEEERILLTGRIHIDKADLRGEGENLHRAVESLNGKLRFEVEDGVIERFNILAKIFSVLNISQVLVGRFPDLTTRGLPFYHIKANIKVRNGIASTEDFLVDSDAMRITLFGKVDLGKNTIDARIGIHPFVTLDAVLSKIPIAGYILTGKDRGLISFFYEVKGDLDDPQIEAIPVKGLGEDFLGIVQRLLETPFRPFQKPAPDK